MNLKYPAWAAVLFVSGMIVFGLFGPPARGVAVPGDMRDAVGGDDPGNFDAAVSGFKNANIDVPLPLPQPSEDTVARGSPDELAGLAESVGMSPDQDLLGLYMQYWISEQASISPEDLNKGLGVAAGLRSRQLPLLYHRKVPVQYSTTEEGEAAKVEFWTAGEAGGPRTRGVFRLYRPVGPDGRRLPLILFLPPSRDPRFLLCKGFCRYFLKNGMQCAYFEKQMGSLEVESRGRQGEASAQYQAPPTSVETAKLGLDVLESMGVIRPGEKIGVGGVSMGAIEASLIALTDERVGAAVLVLGGGNVAKMLVSINGAGVKGYVELREKLMRERGWTLENLERELAPFTMKWDPLAYLKAIPEGRRLRPDRFLMINVIGDQAISNERSDDLYRALTGSAGRHPVYERLWLPVPADGKHVGLLLRLAYVKEKASAHFKQYLGRSPAAQ